MERCVRWGGDVVGATSFSFKSSFRTDQFTVRCCVGAPSADPRQRRPAQRLVCCPHRGVARRGVRSCSARSCTAFSGRVEHQDRQFEGLRLRADPSAPVLSERPRLRPCLPRPCPRLQLVLCLGRACQHLQLWRPSSCPAGSPARPWPQAPAQPARTIRSGHALREHTSRST